MPEPDPVQRPELVAQPEAKSFGVVEKPLSRWKSHAFAWSRVEPAVGR